MARYYHFRFDIWVCLLVGFLVSLGVERAATAILSQRYEEEKANSIVETGKIGGEATDETFRAQSIDDLLSHDTFTVVSKGIKWRNEGGGYYNNFYVQSLELPSGERVAARVNNSAVKYTGESIYSGDSILPVGRVVYADLNDHPTFLGQIEFTHPLTRKDFYIDMVGKAAIASKESAVEAPVLLLQLLTIIAVFALAHFAGSKIGLFPAFYTRKRSEEEKKSDWE